MVMETIWEQTVGREPPHRPCITLLLFSILQCRTSSTNQREIEPHILLPTLLFLSLSLLHQDQRIEHKGRHFILIGLVLNIVLVFPSFIDF